MARAETPIFRGDQQVGAEILSDCIGASEYLPQSTTAQYSKRGHLVRVFRRLPLAGESAGRMPAPRVKAALIRNFRNGGHQRLRVGILGLHQDLGGGAEFDELAGAHYGYASGQLSYYRQGVRNEDIGEI